LNAPRSGVCCLGLLLVACNATSPADRAQWEQGAARLLQPLLTDGDVACGELLIEISPNYYSNVGQPAVDVNLHSARKEKTATYDETIWTNRVGDNTGQFTVTIGADDQFTDKGLVRGKMTRFRVLHEVRLRVFTSGRMAVRLDVKATGQPLVATGDGKPRNLTEWRVSDGVLTAR